MKAPLLPDRIREHLRAAPDGVSSGTVARALDAEVKYVANTLQSMHDAYIDRWAVGRSRGGLLAMWVLHPVPDEVRALRRTEFRAWCRKHVPEDCPKPELQRAA